MAGFTPGPWEWSTNFNGYETVLRGRAGAAVLVPDSRDGAPPWVDVSDDDARLIAAAPDLLAAVTDILAAHAVTELCKPEELEHAHARLNDALMRGHAAVAKAEAQS